MAKRGKPLVRSQKFAPLEMTEGLQKFCGNDAYKMAFVMRLHLMLAEDGQMLILNRETMKRLQTETGRPEGWTEEEVKRMLDELATKKFLSRHHLNKGCIWSETFAENSAAMVRDRRDPKYKWIKHEPTDEECITGKFDLNVARDKHGRALSDDALAEELQKRSNRDKAIAEDIEEKAAKAKKAADRKKHNQQEKEQQEQERFEKFQEFEKYLKKVGKDAVKTLDEKIPTPGKEMQRQDATAQHSMRCVVMGEPWTPKVGLQQAQQNKPKVKPNRFSNFSQRNDYDFDRLEQIKREQQSRKHASDEQQSTSNEQQSTSDEQHTSDEQLMTDEQIKEAIRQHEARHQLQIQEGKQRRLSNRGVVL